VASFRVVDRRVSAVALLAALALMGAGCGSDDESGATGTAEPSETASQPSGEPMKIGLTFVASGPEEQTEYRHGVEASVRRINEDLGGVDGRPIELETCSLDGSPESAARCANELLANEPLAVVNGVDAGGNASLPIYQKADVAVVSYSARGDQATVNPSAVTLGGGFPLLFGAWVKFLVDDLDAKKISFLYPELVPAEAIEGFFGAPARALGAEVKIVSYSPTAPDLTAPVSAATDSDPDVLATVFLGKDRCVQGIKTLSQLGVKAKVSQLECNEDDVLEQVGPAAEGEYFVALNEIGSGVTDTPDIKEYLALMEEYAPDTDPYGEARLGAMSMMTLYSVLKESGAKPTPAKVLKQFKSRPGHLFLGDEYECNALEAFPSLCVNRFRFAQIKDGERVPASDWVSGVELLQPPR
jgi:branched-chain amino acid transport system substrate-binding protein